MEKTRYEALVKLQKKRPFFLLVVLHNLRSPVEELSNCTTFEKMVIRVVYLFNIHTFPEKECEVAFEKKMYVMQDATLLLQCRWLKFLSLKMFV